MKVKMVRLVLDALPFTKIDENAFTYSNPNDFFSTSSFLSVFSYIFFFWFVILTFAQRLNRDCVCFTRFFVLFACCWKYSRTILRTKWLNGYNTAQQATRQLLSVLAKPRGFHSFGRHRRAQIVPSPT